MAKKSHSTLHWDCIALLSIAIRVKTSSKQFFFKQCKKKTKEPTLNAKENKNDIAYTGETGLNPPEKNLEG